MFIQNAVKSVKTAQTYSKFGNNWVLKLSSRSIIGSARDIIFLRSYTMYSKLWLYE